MAQNHRERVFRSLEHSEPDRVPLDEPEGRFRSDTLMGLREYLNVDDYDVILDYLGIDFRHLERGVSRDFRKKAKLLGVPFDGYYIQLGENIFEDEWGTRYEMTSDRLHWRYIHHPLVHIEDLEDYEFPDINSPGRFYEAENIIKEKKGAYVIGAHLWGSLLEQALALRSYDRFFVDLFRNERFVNKLLDELLKYRIEEAKYFVDLGVDIVQFGDDIGMQTTMLISPNLWRRYFKPRMKELINSVKKYSGNNVWIFYHSDGYIEPVIDDLIEIGVQILNPIQPECMNPASIKKRWGNQLVLHGCISTQRTLPFGSREDVKKEVIMRVRECGERGGLILAPSHSPQPDVPVENIVTLYEAAKHFKGGCSPERLHRRNQSNYAVGCSK